MQKNSTQLGQSIMQYSKEKGKIRLCLSYGQLGYKHIINDEARMQRLTPRYMRVSGLYKSVAVRADVDMHDGV